MKTISLKRVYKQPVAEDGFRILVDRLWPRGLSREKAAVDLWLKEIAPSAGLRKWFNHEQNKWEEFRQKYRGELEESQEAIGQLMKIAKERQITLVYGARDEEHNDAVVLLEFLNGM